MFIRTLNFGLTALGSKRLSFLVLKFIEQKIMISSAHFPGKRDDLSITLKATHYYCSHAVEGLLKVFHDT